MRLKNLFLIAMLCATLSAGAQQIRLGEMTRVKTDGPAYHPSFTNDGMSILTSSEDYIGLKETNLATGETRVLSTERRAGLKTFRQDASKGKTVNGVDLKINIVDGSTVTTLTPNGDNERYLWPALSPDATKVAYSVSGKGSYVYDISTGAVSFIGKYRAPQWIDNDYVVVMNDRDDGYQITGSTVLVCAASGSFAQEVTPGDMIAMFPSAMPGKIAFHTLEGEIYILDITITK